MDPKGPDATTIAGVAWYLFVVGGLVCVAVGVVIVLVWTRSRRHTDAAHDDSSRDAAVEADAEVDDAGSERMVRWLGAYIPALILAVTFGVTLAALVATRAEGDADIDIEITGRQWFWDVVYPDDGIRSANEIHIPVDRKVTLHLTSGDVIHSFWVPKLDRKMDLIPGRTNTLDLEATEPGTYEGVCAEFCGMQHTNMRILVVAQLPAQYDTWVAAQSQPGAAPQTPSELEGQQILLGSACAYCHTISGTNASGQVGPDLTHVSSRRDLAAGTVRNTPGNLGAWLLDPQHLKPGNHMPASELSGEELNAVIAYLESLD